MKQTLLEKRLVVLTNKLITKHSFLNKVKQEISKNADLYLAFEKLDLYISNLEDTISLYKKENETSLSTTDTEKINEQLEMPNQLNLFN